MKWLLIGLVVAVLLVVFAMCRAARLGDDMAGRMADQDGEGSDRKC